MTRSLVCVAVVIAAACSGRDAKIEHLGDVTYVAPDGWQRTDTHTPGDLITTWTPRDNVHKESLQVIRAEVSRALARGGIDDLAPMLASAQSELRDAHVGKPMRVASKGGLVGFRIEADFVPVGARQAYHRVHVVLLDHKGVLVHVLYTATGDVNDMKVINQVVRSLAHGEA